MAEQLTYGDLASEFERIAKACRSIPSAILAEIDHADKEQLVDLKTRATAVMAEIASVQAALDNQVTAMCNREDDNYKRIKVARELMKRQIAQLVADDPMPNIFVPCGMMDLIVLTERFSHLDDKQWARVIELAKALKQ